VINHNIEEYEWVEKNFDSWYLTHKQRDYSIARVGHFGGWTVQLAEEDPLPMKVNSLEAAKTIAMINAVANFERFNNAYLYPRRTPKPTSQEIRERVLQMGGVRR
jgi:hypothetical protein